LKSSRGSKTKSAEDAERKIAERRGRAKYIRKNWIGRRRKITFAAAIAKKEEMKIYRTPQTRW